MPAGMLMGLLRIWQTYGLPVLPSPKRAQAPCCPAVPAATGQKLLHGRQGEARSAAWTCQLQGALPPRPCLADQCICGAQVRGAPLHAQWVTAAAAAAAASGGHGGPGAGVCEGGDGPPALLLADRRAACHHQLERKGLLLPAAGLTVLQPAARGCMWKAMFLAILCCTTGGGSQSVPSVVPCQAMQQPRRADPAGRAGWLQRRAEASPCSC
jgi:hypothetical protein